MDKHKLLEAFGRKVQEYRLRRKLSQEELAEMVNIHRNHIGRIERGETNPTLDLIYRLAKALHISAKDLV